MTLAYRLHEAFTSYGNNPAILVEGRTYTYDELFRASKAIARRIIQQYPDSNSPVAIAGGKNFMAYASICGALLASRAYMPLNSKFPAARNRKMIDLSGAVMPDLDITPGELMETEAGIDLRAKPEDTAYLLFTSGTTGIPKGVPVSNENVCAYLDHVMDTWVFREDDRFSQTFDLTFDLSVHDMFVCWLSGACLCIPEDESPFKMAAYIREQAITVWFSVPSAAVLMNKMRLLKAGGFDSTRLSFFCGEPLPSTIADKWLEAAPKSKLINLYGPSEATIAISAYTWDDDNRKEMNGIVSLGKIFNGQRSILIDPDKIIPADKKGELCLGGSQVIKGYLGDEELNERYFIQLKGSGDTWYRTGDMACVDEDGDLFFLGRTDAEVKISGYRVNLMEIEAVLRKAAPGTDVAAVLQEKDLPGITCFVSGKPDMDERSLLSVCRSQLPWYMMPERIIFVEEMPLNINGKIDRNRLKEMLHGQK